MAFWLKKPARPSKKIARDTERDNFMSADAAAEYGLIDKVLTTRGLMLAE